MTGIFIGIGGRLRAGKDAVADHLVEAHGFVKLGMSDPLLEHSLILDPYIPVNAHPAGTTRDAMQGLFVRASELVHEVGYVEAKKNDEYRRFLQASGTEGGRDFHHQDVWVDHAAKTIGPLLDDGQNVVLTGVRFPNEIGLIERFAGYSVWVERPGLDSGTPSAGHASENSVDSADFTYTLLNNGTLDDLHRAADRLLEGANA